MLKEAKQYSLTFECTEGVGEGVGEEVGEGVGKRRKPSYRNQFDVCDLLMGNKEAGSERTFKVEKLNQVAAKVGRFLSLHLYRLTFEPGSKWS